MICLELKIVKSHLSWFFVHISQVYIPSSHFSCCNFICLSNILLLERNSWHISHLNSALVPLQLSILCLFKLSNLLNCLLQISQVKCSELWILMCLLNPEFELNFAPHLEQRNSCEWYFFTCSLKESKFGYVFPHELYRQGSELSCNLTWLSK